VVKKGIAALEQAHLIVFLFFPRVEAAGLFPAGEAKEDKKGIPWQRFF
jgi:hypothetical protein